MGAAVKQTAFFLLILYKVMQQEMNVNRIFHNVMAGLTVSFVALSLGAAFGLLSGRGAFAGMMSAAIIASVTAAFGGTRIQTSGPTGPMTAVTAVAVAAAHDGITAVGTSNPEHFINIVVILTGVCLLIMGVLRLGKFITYVPNVVISGFMNGIAIIIWMDQIKKLFGWGGKVAFTGSVTVNVCVTIITTVLVFGLPVLVRRYWSKMASLLSGTLLAILIMTAISVWLHLPIEHVSLTSSIKSWNDAGQLILSQWPRDWSKGVLMAALPFALQLAVLAYLDTLLTSLVIDKMTSERTRQNKELIAQGFGAALVGLVGGIPGAQATIRSVLIVKEKADMRLAGIMVGVFALVEMLAFQNLINLIPQAVFAGVLIKVGYDVFDWVPVKLYLKELLKGKSEMWRNFLARHDSNPIFVTNREMLMIIGTTLVTVLFDLNTAVGVFTVLYYVLNKWLMKQNPMRDLKPVLETEGVADEG